MHEASSSGSVKHMVAWYKYMVAIVDKNPAGIAVQNVPEPWSSLHILTYGQKHSCKKLDTLQIQLQPRFLKRPTEEYIDLH